MAGPSDDAAMDAYLIVSALTCLNEAFERPAVVQPPFRGANATTSDNFEPLKSPVVTEPAIVKFVGAFAFKE